MNRLEVHHIFPKSQLYKRGFKRAEVNALANFCFLTKDTNLQISNRLPEAYFPEIEAKHPGALASQWIPTDRSLWQVDRFRDFLDARRNLLAAETNSRLAELLHGETKWLDGQGVVVVTEPSGPAASGITSEAEEQELETLNDWLEELDLPRGELAFDLADAASGDQLAMLDVAWPRGLQEGLSQPVALLLNEGPEALASASAAGFRCFTIVEDFKRYVKAEIVATAG